jgi:hypothetical protein
VRSGLGKVLGGSGIDILNIVPVEILKKKSNDALMAALAEIGFKGTLPNEGVVFILYRKDGKKFLVQMAEKDKVPAANLPGYEWVVSDKYVVKYMPEGYQEQREPQSTEKRVFDSAEIYEEMVHGIPAVGHVVPDPLDNPEAAYEWDVHGTGPQGETTLDEIYRGEREAQRASSGSSVAAISEPIAEVAAPAVKSADVQSAPARKIIIRAIANSALLAMTLLLSGCERGAGGYIGPILISAAVIAGIVTLNLLLIKKGDYKTFGTDLAHKL